MKFTTILADPPWTHKGPGWLGGAKRHYPLMSVEEIAALDVEAYANAPGHLWLWTTDEHLRSGAAVQVVKAWGFRDVAIWPWRKLTKNPLTSKQVEAYQDKGRAITLWRGELYGVARPQGFHGRPCHEYLILGVRGHNIADEVARQAPRELVAPWTGVHSEKPPEQYELIERYSPGPYLELFARKHREGWTIWGNEVERGIIL